MIEPHGPVGSPGDASGVRRPLGIQKIRSASAYLGVHVSVEFEVFHDGRFWVGVLTVHTDIGVQASRVVFGAEPSDAELYDFLQKNGHRLLREADTNPSVSDAARSLPTRNPKRAARESARAVRRGLSTASQEALNRAREQAATVREREQQHDTERAAEEKRQQRRAKARAKHRGH